jgi:hypothetical protein
MLRKITVLANAVYGVISMFRYLLETRLLSLIYFNLSVAEKREN